MLRSVERYKLPCYRDLAPVFFLGEWDVGPKPDGAQAPTAAVVHCAAIPRRLVRVRSEACWVGVRLPEEGGAAVATDAALVFSGVPLALSLHMDSAAARGMSREDGFAAMKVEGPLVSPRLVTAC